MNLKLYDILSALIPGFLFLLALLEFFAVSWDNNKVVAYTAVAFLLGYIVNTIGSWLEEVYFISWGGKPSCCLLSGNCIWKVKFYHANQAVNLLSKETGSESPSSDELFSVAMRYANGDARVEDFNSSYAFSRSLLTCVFIGGIFLLIRNYYDWRFYAVILPAIWVVWLRTKQRAYYYTREVLSVYLKTKSD